MAQVSCGPSALDEILAILPNLTALQIVSGCAVSKELLAGTEVALNLSHDSSAWHLYDELHMGILARCFKSLTALDLSHVNLAMRGTARLAGSLSQLTGLTSLGLAGCIKNSQGPNVCKMEWLFQLSVLKVLDLSDNISTVFDLVRGLNDCSRDTLTSLFLNDLCEEYDDDDEVIESQPSGPLPLLLALTELDLGGNILEHALVSSFSGLTALKVLNLDGCKLDNEVWAAVGTALSSGSLAGLTSLDMSMCNQNDDAGLAVAISLGHLTALQSIRLWGNLHEEETSVAVCSALLGLSIPMEVEMDCGPSRLIKQLRSGGSSVLLSNEEALMQDEEESMEGSGPQEGDPGNASEESEEGCRSPEGWSASEDEDEDYDELEDELMEDMEDVLPCLMQELMELQNEAREHQRTLSELPADLP